MYTKIVCAGKIPQSEETLEQVIVVLSRWQRQAKGDSSSLSSLGPKWLQTSPQPPKVSNINAIKWKPKNAHILKYKGGGDFLLWWGLINHSGLGYLSCARPSSPRPSMEASTLFFLLLISAVGRKYEKNYGISLSDSWDDGLIRRFFWPCKLFGDGGCFESQATSRVRARSCSWTRE